jgi:hypothetical protein
VEQSAKATVNGPLPVIGVHYVWEFYPQWTLEAMFQFFAVKFDQYDGNLQDYTATVFYMPWKNFGFGAGWNASRTNVNVSSTGYDGNLTWRYGGRGCSSGRPTEVGAGAMPRSAGARQR